jgi:hypothetical protein
MMVDLPTGLSSLADLYQSTANPEAVTDLHQIFGQAGCCDILSKAAQALEMRVELMSVLAEIFPPRRIMFHRIEMDRLLRATMDAGISDTIPFKAFTPQPDRLRCGHPTTNRTFFTIIAKICGLPDK